MPLKVLTGLFSSESAVRFGSGVVRMPGWVMRYLAACRGSTYQANRRRMQRLALYSRERLEALTLVHGLEFDQTRGYMTLLRSEREAARARDGLPLLQEIGVKHELLSPEQARIHEPSLSSDAPLHAAIWLPQDWVGNCRQFAQALKAKAQERHATFRFGAEVIGLAASQSPSGLACMRLRWRSAGLNGASDVSGTKALEEVFDHVVLCTGQVPAALAKGLKLRVPTAPVYGYSMTAPIRHRDGVPDPGPRSGVMDERYKVSITRLGQRVRVAGIAELGTSPDVMRDAPLQTLYRVLDEWFPGAAELAKVQHWKGMRPMLPDGPPLIGPAAQPGLWLNLGHGGSGWALSCGSARALADLLAGRTPQIDMEGLGLARLG